MTARKPSAVFEALFERRDLHPEQIPIGHLTRVLSAVQRLATGRDEPDDGDGLRVEETKIGLLQIRRGSAVYQFSAPVPGIALGHLRETGRVLERPDEIGESDYILNPVEELSAIARSLECAITLKVPGKGGPVLARIGPDSYASVSRRLLISGETTIVGRVERVGGATEQKCGLRIPSQSRMLFCKVASTETARKLGQKLYEEVVAQGTASWLRTSWRIVAFNIQDVYQPEFKSATRALDALRAAGGKAWDDVEDPQAFLDEIAGER